MSVVRDILGVGQAQGPTSPLAAVMSTLSGPKVSKKRKSFISKFESKELASLRDSETLVRSPLTAGTPTTPEAGESSKSWKWRKFRISSRPNDETVLSHWDNRTDESRDYSAVRCDISVDMVDLSKVDSSVLEEIMSKYQLTTQDLEDLFQDLKQYALNFIVVADRTKLKLSVEQIKDIYYATYMSYYPNKKCKYSYSVDVERKRILEERQLAMATEGIGKIEDMKKQEKKLSADIKELEARIKAIDADGDLLEKLIKGNPTKPTTPSRKSIQGPHLASAGKKPNGYDLINKYLPGVVALTGKKPDVQGEGSSTISYIGKQPIDFSAFTKVPEYCTSYNSAKVASFFQELNELMEKEKLLTSFIKKREAEIKSLQSSSKKK